MSVLVPSLTNNAHHHAYPHHSSYFTSMSSTSNLRRLNNTAKINSNLAAAKSSETEQEGDHVPYGVVKSRKQRLFNKVNESYLLHHTSTTTRTSLSKPNSRLSSNENLLQPKSASSPLKRATRLSRSQDNLCNPQSNSTCTSVTEPFNSYLRPKQDVIIVDTSNNRTHSQECVNQLDDNENKLQTVQKISTHRQSYTELNGDEAPKPGRRRQIKSMRLDQFRLSNGRLRSLIRDLQSLGKEISLLRS
jgi:hypothetical protein